MFGGTGVREPRGRRRPKSVLISFKLYQSAQSARKTLLLEFDEIVGDCHVLRTIRIARKTQRPALCCIVHCFVDNSFHQQQPYQ
jgi:hypothetical protein